MMLYAISGIVGFALGALLVAKLKHHSDDEFQEIRKENNRLVRKIAAVQFYYRHKLSRKNKKKQQ